MRAQGLRLQFLARQNSELTLRLEAADTRERALAAENARLRGLWQSAQVFLDGGAGI